MTVELALLISSDGIALAHRQQAGHWAILQDVSFASPKLDRSMKRLHREAVKRAGADAGCLLILPDDQILYTSLMAPTDDAERTAFRIEEGLEGMTPYAVSELLYDWRAVESDRVKLAVVARETLDEARGFAETHGFRAAGFAAMPPQERFPGVPVFDLAPEADGLSFSDEGIAFGPDVFGQPDDAPEVIDGAPDAATEAEAPDNAAPDTAARDAAAPDAAAPDALDADAFEQAPDAEAGAEPQDAPERDTTGENGVSEEAVEAAEDIAPETEPEAEPEPGARADAEPVVAYDARDHALSDAADRDPEEVIAAADEDTRPFWPALTPEPAPDLAEASAPHPRLEDPSLTEPVAPLEDSGSDSLSAAVRATRKASAALDTTAPREFSARGEPVAVREDETAVASWASDTAARPSFDSDDDPTPAGQNPLAARLSRVRDASKSRTPGSAKPLVPPSRDAKAGAAAPRRGRLSGLTAAPFPGTGDAARPAPEEPQGIGGRLGALLGLGRTEDAAPPAATPTAAPTLGARSVGTGARTLSSTGRLTALGAALRTTPDGDTDSRPASNAVADSAPSDPEDANLTGGLLGRKPDEAAAPSFRTGLFLTIILLILLAAIAVWSALFLPDSPVARLFGGGSGDVALEDPLDAPEAPVAITAPPAIGELAAVDAPPGSLPDETPAAPAVPALADEAAPETATAVAPEDEAAADGIDLASAPLPEPAAPEAPVAPAAEASVVPPLPPLPLDDIPSLEETEAVYAEYRIWQRPPDRPDLAPLDTLSDLGLSAADTSVEALDAISLPAPRLDPTETFRTVPPPPPFGESPATGAGGLVAATPEGVVTPDGVRVTAGPPPVAAIPRPREQAAPAPPPTISGIEDAILGTFRPEPRPGDLGQVAPEPTPEVPTISRASFSPQPRGLPARPATAAEAAAAASLFAQDADDGDATATGTATAGLGRSLIPATRPGNMEALVASAVQPEAEAPAEVIEAAAIAPGPSIPSNADVARAATLRDEIRLRDVNLIGVTGTPSDRRALVRLPSGRFVRVGVGDRLDGGRVAAIGASTLQYVRNGRTLTLDIPG